LIVLSQLPEANLGVYNYLSGDMSEYKSCDWTTGAQDIVFTPKSWAAVIFVVSHVSSVFLEWIEIEPSVLQAASLKPLSQGAHVIEFTDPKWSEYVYTSCQSFDFTSFQIHTFLSKLHEARMLPNLGWAHAIYHIGPLCALKSINFGGLSPFEISVLETSKIYIFPSAAHVAKRFP